MVDGSVRRREALRRRGPSLFLLGGGLLACYAALLGYEAAANRPTPADVFGPAGFCVAMVGLLGLYSTLGDRRPRLARAGAVVAATSASAWFVVATGAIAEVAGALPPLETVGALGIVVVLAAGASMGLAYVSLGVYIVVADTGSRTLGVLLLAPPGIFGAMLLQAVLFTRFGLFTEAVMAWSAVAISGGQALAHLAIGYVLRTGRPSTGSESPSVDATVG